MLRQLLQIIGRQPGASGIELRQLCQLYPGNRRIDIGGLYLYPGVTTSACGARP